MKTTKQLSIRPFGYSVLRFGYLPDYAATDLCMTSDIKKNECNINYRGFRRNREAFARQLAKE